MADLLVISDAASKSIRDEVYPTLQENHWRTGDHPVLQMLGMEAEAVDQQSGPVNRPRIKPVEQVDAGYQVEVVHEHSLFGGGYCVAEGTSLKYGKRAETRSKATIRFYEGAFKVSRPMIAATRNNDKALVSVISRHAMNALRQAQKDLGRMATYKKEGMLALVNGAVSASTVVAVDNDSTSEGICTRYLRPSMKVWVGTTTAIAAGTADECEINTITSKTGLTMTSAQTFADNDYIVPAGVYADSAYREFNGMDTLIAATGTVQNVDKAANFFFQSDVTASVGTLAISDVDTAALGVRSYMYDPSQLFLAAGPGPWRRYSNLLTATKQVMTTVKDFDGVLGAGASKLVYFAPDGQYPVFLCEDVIDQTIYGIDAEGYFWAEMLPLQFEDTNGSMGGVAGTRIPGTSNYEFPLLHYGQLVQTNARGSFRLNGITA